MSTQRRLRRSEASDYIKDTWGLSYKANTLAKLATIGGGPSYELFGRWPVYREAELDKWVEDRLSGLKSSTSDKGALQAIQAGVQTTITRPAADISGVAELQHS